MDYDQFRRSVRDELIVQRLRQRVVQSRVQVSDAEVDTLINNGAMHRGQLHLGYILVAVPDGATPDQIETARKKAEDAKQQIDGGMDFAAAAIRYSDAQNALEGGDLGWRAADELPQAFAEAAATHAGRPGVARRCAARTASTSSSWSASASEGAQVVTEYQRAPHPDQDHRAGQQRAGREDGRERSASVWSPARTSPRSPRKSRRTTATARLGGDLGWFAGDAYGTARRRSHQEPQERRDRAAVPDRRRLARDPAASTRAARTRPTTCSATRPRTSCSSARPKTNTKASCARSAARRMSRCACRARRHGARRPKAGAPDRLKPSRMRSVCAPPRRLGADNAVSTHATLPRLALTAGRTRRHRSRSSSQNSPRRDIAADLVAIADPDLLADAARAARHRSCAAHRTIRRAAIADARRVRCASCRCR